MPPTSPIPLAQHIPTILFLTVTVLASTLISRTQPTPYIDEIFHIPQAQRFCSALTSTSIFLLQDVWKSLASVEYDTKLTTPPGLYAISVGLAKILPGWECSDVVWLRSTNLVLLLTLPVLIARIIRQNQDQAASPSTQVHTLPKLPANKKAIPRSEIELLQQKARLEPPPTPDASSDDLSHVLPAIISYPNDVPGQAQPASEAGGLPRAPKRNEASVYTMAVACTLAFLPPLWFFGFLYYTDLASIWLVLACLTLYNDLNSSTSTLLTTSVLISLTSMLAVAVRQTNIVWVAFCAAQSVHSRLPALAALDSSGLVGEVRQVLRVAFGKKKREFWKLVSLNAAPLVPMMVGSAWFVRWNGSIVLGDKANHQAGLHLAQMGYFLAFACGFGLFPLVRGVQPRPRARPCSIASAMVNAVREVVKAAFGSVSRVVGLVAVVGGFWFAVERYTIDHPFLLADNRHYTFYVWRIFRKSYKISGTPFAVEPRFVMVPMYAIGLFAWTTALSRTTHWAGLFNILFWCATAATLVPTPLIEPRYYLLPYLILRIYSQPHEEDKRSKEDDAGRRCEWLLLGLELATYAVVNVVTTGLFVGKPFEWERDAVDQSRNEGTTMRFIW